MQYISSEFNKASTANNKIDKVKRQVGITECGSDYFKYKNRTEVLMFGVDKLMCLKFENYTLQGDYYSERFNYI